MRHSKLLKGLVLVAVAASVAGPVLAQALKVGVVDLEKVIALSVRGKEMQTTLKAVSDEKAAELQTMQEGLRDLQQRIANGQLSLSEETLRDLQTELEEKGRTFERSREDANRLLQKRRDQELEKLERELLAVLSSLGEEQGFTMLFNKFQSGLIFADEKIDITDEVIARFDASVASD